MGIREKILTIYGFGFLIILGISALVQVYAYQAGTEFETRLNQYYAMQTLRVALSDVRKKSEQYLRNVQPERKAELTTALELLPSRAEAILAMEHGAGQIPFRAVAVRRGLVEYRWRSIAGFQACEAQAPDAYQLYLAADRIAGYVDQYLDILLSHSLADGTAWYRTISAHNEDWRQIALAANLVTLAAAVILAFLLAGSISRPIRRLALASERMAAGDLDVDPVTATTGDEVEILARSFTTMSRNIREMVGGLQEKAALEQKLHEDEVALIGMDRDLKEARFYALQSRIRPHFLFNALNTLARSALLEGAGETEKLTRSLAALMRYSLGAAEAFVGVGEELAMVREYLSFQSIRFGQRLTWAIHTDPEALGFLIPRFTLQPLVENAVLHGIEPVIGGGQVVILARARAQRIKLAVYDNGGGMPAEVLARVRASMRDQRVTELGIGTASLESRLSFLYQQGIRTAAYSSPSRGTMIVISIPKGEL